MYYRVIAQDQMIIMIIIIVIIADLCIHSFGTNIKKRPVLYILQYYYSNALTQRSKVSWKSG